MTEAVTEALLAAVLAASRASVPLRSAAAGSPRAHRLR
jgi:hypothetical protein